MDDDELRDLLADQAVWTEPSSDLEERIVAAITGAAEQPPADVTPFRSRRMRYAVLGTAAAVLLGVALTVGLVTQRSRPMEYAASLQGTTLAPRASGTVTLTRTTSGWKIRLHAKGLPRRDNDTYYEAWLKNDAGELVPIGTFNEGDDVILWAGVPPESYPTLTVTRQLANGEPASTGQVVLLGTSHRTH
jgi:hypothetical protein